MNSFNFSLSIYWADFLSIPLALTNLLTKIVDYNFLSLLYLGKWFETKSKSSSYLKSSLILLYASISFKQVPFNNLNS